MLTVLPGTETKVYLHRLNEGQRKACEAIAARRYREEERAFRPGTPLYDDVQADFAEQAHEARADFLAGYALVAEGLISRAFVEFPNPPRPEEKAPEGKCKGKKSETNFLAAWEAGCQAQEEKRRTWLDAEQERRRQEYRGLGKAESITRCVEVACRMHAAKAAAETLAVETLQVAVRLVEEEDEFLERRRKRPGYVPSERYFGCRQEVEDSPYREFLQVQYDALA